MLGWQFRQLVICAHHCRGIDAKQGEDEANAHGIASGFSLAKAGKDDLRWVALW